MPIRRLVPPKMWEGAYHETFPSFNTNRARVANPCGSFAVSAGRADALRDLDRTLPYLDKLSDAAMIRRTLFVVQTL